MSVVLSKIRIRIFQKRIGASHVVPTSSVEVLYSPSGVLGTHLTIVARMGDTSPTVDSQTCQNRFDLKRIILVERLLPNV